MCEVMRKNVTAIDMKVAFIYPLSNRLDLIDK